MCAFETGKKTMIPEKKKAPFSLSSFFHNEDGMQTLELAMIIFIFSIVAIFILGMAERLFRWSKEAIGFALAS